MKQVLLNFTLLTALLSAVACSDDEAKSPDSVFLYSTEAEVSAEAGTKSITIVTTCAWSAESNQAWLTIDPASGSEAGFHAVHLIYEANADTLPRTGVVTFRAGTYSDSFTLTQLQPK